MQMSQAQSRIPEAPEKERKVMSIDDQLLSRDRRKINIIYAQTEDGEDVIFEFKWQSVPGILRINSKKYTKQGKWSHDTWELELSPGVELVTLAQDFWTSKWFTCTTWSDAIARIQKLFPTNISEEAVMRFIRYKFKWYAQWFDASEKILDAPRAHVQEILDLQTEFQKAQAENAGARAQVESMIEAKEIKKKTQQVREDTARITAALEWWKSMSLWDLQALLNNK